MPASLQASSSTRAATGAPSRPVPTSKGNRDRDRPVPITTTSTTSASSPSRRTSRPSGSEPADEMGMEMEVEVEGMSTDPFSPLEITSAVDQLVQELVTAQQEVTDRREKDLVNLYLMVRTLIRGQGFAMMDDLKNGDDGDETDRGNEVKEQLELEDRDGLKMFLTEYLLKEGSEPAHIRLPDLSHYDLKSIYPAPQPEPSIPTVEVIPPEETPEEPMEVDVQDDNETPSTSAGLPLPISTTLPRPPSLVGVRRDHGEDADSRQVQELLDDDERSMRVEDEHDVVEVPDFNIPIVYEKQDVYTPRLVRKLFKEQDPTMETDDGLVDKGRARPWIGSDRNLALFEPPHHPLFFPPAGTGYNVPESDESMNPTVSPFGIPLSESLPRIPSAEEAAGQRKQRLDDLVPLESPYAGTLHPLPSGVVNSLGKRGHRHHHHHHRRDRRRSSVGGGSGGDTAQAVPPTTTTTTASSAQTAKVASSVMIPGTSAYALPPAYATNRKMGSMSFDQIKAQNEELNHQRAGQRDREDVDLVELGVGFTVNPVARMIKRNNKCMMSRDWKTVWREIQFTRALERVEQLKDEGAWSFRQMKKFRGPPTMGGKSHWDWLLDEMRWMQADFKEERRWKIVLAQEMAAEVRRWYKADDVERAKMMVGGRGWGRNRPPVRRRGEDGMDVDRDEDGQQRVEEANEVQGADEVLEGMLERDRDVEIAKEHIQEAGKAEQPVVKPKEEADEDAEGEEDGDGEPDEDAEGEKDDEDEDAAGEVDDEAAYAGDEDAIMAEGIARTVEEARAQAAMRDNALGPAAHSQNDTLMAEPDQPAPIDEREAFIAAAPAVRKPLLDSDPSAVVVDIQSIVRQQAAERNVVVPEDVILADLFPDLSVYTGPVMNENKVERRSDESAGRLTHTTRLMDIRPVIVSSIQPSLTRRPDGKWQHIDQGFLHEPEDDLEEFRFDPAAYPAPIFEGKKARPIVDVSQNRAPEQPRNAAIRSATVLWDEQDDDMLLRLIRDYAWNWRLIADLFNSARGTISTDKRSGWDCYHRWDQKWGPTSKATAAANATAQGEPMLTPAQQDLQQARAQAQAIAIANHAQTGVAGPPPVPGLAISTGTATTPTPASAPMPGGVPNTTPVPASAVPTSAVATSVTAGDESADMNGVTSPGAARREAKLQREARYQGSKRKVRNNTMRDAIRRSQKRREINRKNNLRETIDGQQVVNIHESHSGFLPQRGVPVPTPQELSQMQYERVLAEHEKSRMTSRLAEQRQQQIVQQQRMHQAQMQQQQQQAQQQAQAQAQAQQQQHQQLQNQQHQQIQQQQQQPPQQQQQQQQQGRSSQTPVSNGPSPAPRLTAPAPVGAAGRQPPTPGAAQQIAMQQTQMVTQALQVAAAQQMQQQGPNSNGGQASPVGQAPMSGQIPNSVGVGAQGQQPRAQITGPNMITLANGQRLTVPPQGSPNMHRLQNQLGQQRTAGGIAGSPANSHPVQGQPQGTPHMPPTPQSGSRPASRTGQTSGPNSNAGPSNAGGTGRQVPGGRGAGPGNQAGAPRQMMAVGKSQIPSSEFIAKLLQKAGLPSLASIPLNAPAEGTTWSKDQITQMQVEYLHNLALAQAAKAAEARAAHQQSRSDTPGSNPGSATGNNSTGANTPTNSTMNVGGNGNNNGNPAATPGNVNMATASKPVTQNNPVRTTGNASPAPAPNSKNGANGKTGDTSSSSAAAGNPS